MTRTAKATLWPHHTTLDAKVRTSLESLVVEVLALVLIVAVIVAVTAIAVELDYQHRKGKR